MEICGIQGSGCLWIVCDHYGFGKPSVCCVYKVKDTLDFRGITGYFYGRNVRFTDCRRTLLVLCFLCALQMGMLAGTLSLAASFLSMFVSNKMLILITPILIQQILLEYRGKGWFSVMLIYPTLNRFSTDIQYFLTVFGCSLCFSALLTWGIYKNKSRL